MSNEINVTTFDPLVDADDRSAFDVKRRYAQMCGNCSKEYNIPFDVMLAVSPKFAEEFYNQYEKLKVHTERCGPPPQLTIEALKGKPIGHTSSRLDLYAMKDVILALLEPSYDFRIYIEGLGFTHSKRIADYLLLLW